MPQSLVLNLVTQTAIPREHLQGYMLQQLFFNLVKTVDPQLGNALCRDEQNRAYSLSALQLNESSDASGNLYLLKEEKTTHLEQTQQAPKQVKKGALQQPAKALQIAPQTLHLQYGHDQPIAPNTACWWRISFLDDGLFDHLIFLWNQLQNECFPLGSGRVMIHSIAADLPSNGLTTGIPQQDWASSCSYRDIYEQASAGDRNIHFQFITPTVFEQAGRITALPTVEAVFQTLRRRWNCYSGLAFAPRLIDNIFPTYFNIQTQLTQIFRRSLSEPITGCLGHISFRITDDSDALIIQRLNTLADFTRYCPVGCNTQLGMGVIHRLSSLNALNSQPLQSVK